MTTRAGAPPTIVLIGDPARARGLTGAFASLATEPVVLGASEAAGPHDDAELILLAVDPADAVGCCRAAARGARCRVVPLLHPEEFDLLPDLVDAGAADFVPTNANPAVVAVRLRMNLAAPPPADAAAQLRLELAVQSTGTGVWDWDIPTGRLTVNDAWAEMLGYTRAELEPLTIDTWNGVCHPEDRAAADELTRRVLQGSEDVYAHETRLRHRDGHWIWVLDRARVVDRGVDGRPLRMIGTHTEITAFKEAQRTAAERDALYRAAVEVAGDPMLVTDADGRILDASGSVERFLGYTRRELLAMTLADVDADIAAHGGGPRRHVGAASEGEGVVFTSVQVRKDGVHVPVEVRAAPLETPKGPLYLGFIRDLTERTRRNALLEAQHRLATASFTVGGRELLRAFVDEAEALSGSSVAFLHFVESDGEHLLLQEWSTNTLATMCTADGHGLHYPVSKAGVWADCLRQREPVIHNDYPSLEARRGLPEGHAPILRELVVPVHRGGKVVALVGVGNKPEPYDELDADLLGTFADQAWELVLRKEAQEQAARHRSEYEAVLAASPDGFWAADVEGRILDCNPAYAAMLGYTEEEVCQFHVWDLTTVPREEVLRRADLVRTTGSMRFDTVHRRKDGTLIEVELAAAFSPHDGGRILAFIRDASERNRTLQDLERRRREYETLVESSPDLVMRIDGEGRRLFESRRFREYGLPPEGTFTEALRSMGIAEEACTAWEALVARAVTGETVSREVSVALPQGTRAFSIRLVPESRDPNGTPTVLVVGRDVTDERRLARNWNEVFQNVEEGIGLCELVFDGAGVPIDYLVVSVNPAFARIFGASRAEMENRLASDVLPLGGADALSAFAELIATGESQDFASVTADGGRVIGVRAHRTTADQFVMVVTDITEQRRAELALRESEERLRGVFDHAPVGIYLMDLAGTILAANPAFAGMLSMTPEQILGRHWSDLTHPDHLQGCRDMMEAAMASPGGTSSEGVEKRYLAAGGREVWARARIAPILRGDGQVAFLSVMVEDLTAQRASAEQRHVLESRLRQAQKMEAIGTLAGGIAHDFNNILAAMLGYAELAQDDLDSGDPTFAQKDLAEVLRAGRRARDLVGQILAFSRQGEQDRRPLRIAPIVKEAVKLLRASIPATIEIRKDLPDTPLTVMADATQIHQVVMNLCTNAFHAMRDTGGVLGIALKSRTVTVREAAALPEIEAGRFASLTVSDTGTGMDDATLAHIFEPYFTTKEPGEGTGLGLATVHGIVTSHGGALQVSSQKGKGTTFEVLLPLAQSAEDPESATRQEDRPTGSERVLVVDDERAICRVVAEGLRRLGYTVATHDDPRQALAAFEADPSAFDVVVTDLTMPHLTGLELSRQLVALRPQLPVVLCSGYAEFKDRASAKEMGIRAVLTKPLSVNELAWEIRKGLDAQA